MGLFDRLRRVFTGETEEEKPKDVTETKETTDVDADQEETKSTTATQEVEPKASETTEREEDTQAKEETQKDTDDKTEGVVESDTDTDTDTASETTVDVVETPGVTEVTETTEQTTETKSVEETVKEPAKQPEVTEMTTTEVVEESEPVKETQPEPEKQVTETERYDKGLARSRKGFGARLNALLANFRSVDEDFFEELEETLIEADVGFDTAMKISDELQDEVKLRNAKSKSDVSDAIIERLVGIYEQEGNDEDNTLHFSETKDEPTVFLFVGVNGVGKTTTIGKLAHRYQQEGKKVLLAAGDTFRAGAIQQLAEWGRRVGVDVVTKPEQSDPAAVVYDAVVKAKKENYDILLVDTAGRLQNKVNLMNELDKIKRVITRELPDAPQEVLLALDATTGQNALTQAKQFKEVTDVTGIVLTKLDGTARGGIVLAIRNELHLPVKLVGLGEKMDDLRDFSPEEFVYGLFKGLVTPKKD